MIVRRVMPSSTFSVIGGVANAPFLNRKKFAAGALSVGFGERGIHVCPRDFAASGDDVVVDAPPGTNGDVHVVFVLVVVAEGQHHHGDFRIQVVDAYTDDFVRVKSQRANV
jgi:hypothetical protein